MSWPVRPSDKKVSCMIKEAVKEAIESELEIDSNPKGYSTLEFASGRRTERTWDQVDDVRLDQDRVFFYSEGQVLDMVERTATNWYKLIQDIPDRFPSFDPSDVAQIMVDLKGCEICGVMAVYRARCEYCGTRTWEDFTEFGFPGEPSEDEYLQEMQQDYWEGRPITGPDKAAASEQGFSVYEAWRKR